MLQINPQFESLFNPHNIDEDCKKIADEIDTVLRPQICEMLKAGKYKEAVTLYLDLMRTMVHHFVDDEHYCYFDDMYAPEYSLQRIYEDIKQCGIGDEEHVMLDIGHSEIMDSECYHEYGYPSYI